MNHLIEIRSINLQPGRREEFHRLYIEEALPLLKRWNFDVWRTARRCMMRIRIT